MSLTELETLLDKKRFTRADVERIWQILGLPNQPDVGKAFTRDQLRNAIRTADSTCRRGTRLPLEVLGSRPGKIQ